MNLVLFLLSFVFASYAPTAQTTNDSNHSSHVKKHEPKKKVKGGKFQDGDFIIAMDIHP